MKDEKHTAGVILSLPDLYRRNMPDFAKKLKDCWKKILPDLFSEYDYFITDTAHTIEEFKTAVEECENRECKIIILIPMAYTSSGATVPVLSQMKLPLILISTSRDFSLGYDISNEDLLANQAMHGVQDISNGLWRHGKSHVVLSGHPKQDSFRNRFRRLLRAAHAAWSLKNGRIGQLGGFFPDMLDFRYDEKLQEKKLGYKKIDLDVAVYLSYTEQITQKEVSEIQAWIHNEFIVEEGFSSSELEFAVRYSLAFEFLKDSNNLDGIAMNFLGLSRNGAKSLPVLGADRLMAGGYGYAGEGDVQTTALMAALMKITADTTFSEMFCPDYERNEILLSHMGECNYRLADPSKNVYLRVRPFSWGDCSRLAVPVFQLKPGLITLTAITQEPDEHLNFRVITCLAEIIQADEHKFLLNPYSRMTVDRDIHEFIEAYSKIGGPHHICISYGDIRDEVGWMSSLTGINNVTI